MNWKRKWSNRNECETDDLKYWYCFLRSRFFHSNFPYFYINLVWIVCVVKPNSDTAFAMMSCLFDVVSLCGFVMLCFVGVFLRSDSLRWKLKLKWNDFDLFSLEHIHIRTHTHSMLLPQSYWKLTQFSTILLNAVFVWKIMIYWWNTNDRLLQALLRIFGDNCHRFQALDYRMSFIYTSHSKYFQYKKKEIQNQFAKCVCVYVSVAGWTALAAEDFTFWHLLRGRFIHEISFSFFLSLSWIWIALYSILFIMYMTFLITLKSDLVAYKWSQKEQHTKSHYTCHDRASDHRE